MIPNTILYSTDKDVVFRKTMCVFFSKILDVKSDAVLNE